MKILWSDQARRDLRAIFDFISRDSTHYARLQVDRIVSRVERASSMPSRGHRVHEAIESDLREVHEGLYRIIYRASDHDFQVVTLTHMRQRLTRNRLS